MAAGDGLGQLTEHRSVLGRYTVRDRTRDPSAAVEVHVLDRQAGLVADDSGGFGDGERFGRGQALCLSGVSFRVGQSGRGYSGDVFGIDEGLSTVPGGHEDGSIDRLHFEADRDGTWRL